MKTIIIFYSYSGKTKKAAADLAQKESADMFEVTDKMKPSKIRTYLIAAFNGKQESNPVKIDFNAYERIIIMAPVRGLRLAPAINNVFDLLPGGKEIEVIAVGGDKNTRKSLLGEIEKLTGKNKITEFGYICAGSIKS